MLWPLGASSGLPTNAGLFTSIHNGFLTLLGDATCCLYLKYLHGRFLDTGGVVPCNSLLLPLLPQEDKARR